jgi:tRNA(Ile)-lysidine synthase
VISSIAASLDRRLDPASAEPLALGFSGGGDSLALLTASLAWAGAHGRRVLALTVDHQLHPDSAAWTREAGAVAERLGADWRGLAWTGDKPARGLPAAARLARHRLLAEAARKAGAQVLLLGHTATDIAESDLMRTDVTPQLGRLRDWAPSPVWPEGRGVFILRPLLGLTRAELRAWLAGQGLGWREDPANDDPRFARARARAALGEDASAIPDGSSSLAAWLNAGRIGAAGEIVLSRGRLRAGPDAEARRVLAASLLCASGGETPPRAGEVARLYERLAGEGDLAATLAGARVVSNNDAVLLVREPRRAGRAEPVLPLLAGATGVFDGRFEVTAAEPLTVVTLAGRAARLGDADRRQLAKIDAPVRPSLPCLITEGGEVALPAPFGAGPAIAHALAPLRWTSALGGIDDERALAEFSLRNLVTPGEVSA